MGTYSILEKRPTAALENGKVATGWRAAFADRKFWGGWVATALLCVVGGPAEASAPATEEAAEITEFWGACDASAVVPLSDDLFVIADDEDNFLRVYSRRQGGLPVAKFNQSRFLGFKKSAGETDLEGGARLGDHIYWISSHGRNSKGKAKPMRQRLFATKVSIQGGDVSLEPTGKYYAGLLRDLAEAPQLRKFRLGQAARNAPKTADALNIEGLVATPSGELLIGLRNPVPQGKALVVPLLNPAEVVSGQAARLGDPQLLDLGGLGIRGMTRWRDRYLIVAGAIGPGGEFGLYEWSGGSEGPRRLDDINFHGLNPEAIAPWPDEKGSHWLVISDDGSRICDGEECKRLKNADRKRFRTLMIPSR